MDQAGAGDLNSSCYMFWDICPLTHFRDVPQEQKLDEHILGVLERTLTIPHKACRESAFHGLGHMAKNYPNQVESIIDQFLSVTQLGEDLRTFASKARLGRIL